MSEAKFYIVAVTANDSQAASRYLRKQSGKGVNEVGYTDLTPKRTDAFYFPGKQAAIEAAREINAQLLDYTATVQTETGSTVWPTTPGKR